MFHELYLRGKELCEQENTPPHFMTAEYRLRLELGYDLSGNLIANLDSVEPFITTAPLERVRTSGAYALLFNDFAVEGKEGDVKPVLKTRNLSKYIEKIKGIVPENDELLHEWLNTGCVVRYNSKIKSGMFALVIDGERAVEKYSNLVLKYVEDTVAKFSGLGLWNDGRLVDNASRVSGGNSLVSYNSTMFENNRPKCNLTMEENAYISRGWNEMCKTQKFLYQNNVKHFVGGIKISPTDAVEAPYVTNADEIIAKYVSMEPTNRTILKNSMLIFFGIVKGRFEHELIVRENAAEIFKNIAKFRSECSPYTSKLNKIIVKHYPAPEGKDAKVEWFNKTPTLYQSIWLDKPISESDIAPISSGLTGYKHFNNPFSFISTFSGALGLAKCYLTRKGISMDNYMYIAGQIMGLLHRQQSAIHFAHNVGGENVIWDLVKNLDRPDQMIGTALTKIIPYQDAKYGGGPNMKVQELLLKIQNKTPKDIHPMDRNMCFFLGFASTYNNSNNNNNKTEEN